MMFMMHMIRKWYYDNKEKILATIITIALILLFINIFNNYYESKQYETDDKTNTINVTTKENINNEIDGELTGSASLTTGGSVSGEKLSKDITIIDKFISNCSEGKIEEAYELLTDECKETNFPTLEVFKTNYYKPIFNIPKIYTAQNWSGNTYKVIIKDDILQTGKVSDKDSQDYMTIPDASIGKININRYIGRTIKEKTTATDNLEFTYVKKETYMDYEEYTIRVKNLTTEEIILDSGESTKNIYLLDSNNVKQYANTAEINYENLVLIPGAIKEYIFRFSNSYSINRTMKTLNFENVIINDNETTKVIVNL